MNNKETQAFKNSVFESQIKILMNIRNFRNDFVAHTEKISGLTKDLTNNYEEAIRFLDANGNTDFKKEWEENLNNVRVEANQMNQVLALSDDFMNENKADHDFLSEWKEFDTRKTWLKQAAKKFENSGLNSLPEEKMEEWKTKYEIWDNSIENHLEEETKFIKLIYDFEQKYSHNDLEKITNIVLENTAEEVDWNNPVEYEKQYIKAIREFQQEFKPQNLWDKLLEILAGGVHPSPSERMMLEQWVDGEQKTREDM